MIYCVPLSMRAKSCRWVRCSESFESLLPATIYGFRQSEDARSRMGATEKTTAPSQSEGWCASQQARRDLAYRCVLRTPGRWYEGLVACRHRQLQSQDPCLVWRYTAMPYILREWSASSRRSCSPGWLATSSRTLSTQLSKRRSGRIRKGVL